MTASNAVRGFPSQSTGPTPMNERTWLSSPTSGRYIHCHTSAIATTEETYGRRNKVRTSTTRRVWQWGHNHTADEVGVLASNHKADRDGVGRHGQIKGAASDRKA